MTTIWERTKSALAPLNVPMAANKYMGDSGELPDTFLVYQLISGAGDEWADNKETQRSRRMQVNIWSRSGLVNLPDVSGAMIGAGFLPSNETELPFFQETGHYGLSLDFVFSESEE